MRPLFSVTDDHITANEPFIAMCGCAGASTAISKTFKLAKISPASVRQIKDRSNTTAAAYLKQEGYFDLMPALSKTVHAVIIHPAKRQALNLMDRDRTPRDLAIDVKEILA